MKFYNRKKELEYLAKINKLSQKQTQLTVLTGRRRVGKTELIKHFLLSIKKDKAFYFFITRKRTKNILEEFSSILAKEFPILATNLQNWEEFFKFIFEAGRKQKITIVLDEFQNFKYIDNSVFSILQKYIDEYKNKSKVNLIVIGSVFTLMEKIFFSSKESLFGRANHKILLKPFSSLEIKQILRDNNKNNFLDLVKFYTVFNGIPKYYYDIDNFKIFNKKFISILEELILCENALLKREGFDLIIDEFGKNYQTYFSIMLSIAFGKTKASQIANTTGIPINSLSQYLEELNDYYKLITRTMPILAEKTKNSRYVINDAFLKFWFRYLYKNWSMVELGNFKPILKFIEKDINCLFGKSFENIISELIVANKIKNFPINTINQIGPWWSRQEAEIDIIAINKKEKQIFFGECKLNNKKVNLELGQKLKEKSQLVQWNNKNRKNFYGIFTIGKVEKNLKLKLKKQEINVWEMK